MAIRPTNEDYQLIQLRTRNNRIKIELLNFNYQTIDSLEGNAIEGSISVDANSDIRRNLKIRWNKIYVRRYLYYAQY